MTEYFQSSIYKIIGSSLSDGLPKRYNLIVPKDEVSDDGKGILLTISIEDPKEKLRQPICLKPVHGDEGARFSVDFSLFAAFTVWVSGH